MVDLHDFMKRDLAFFCGGIPGAVLAILLLPLLGQGQLFIAVFSLLVVASGLLGVWKGEEAYAWAQDFMRWR